MADGWGDSGGADAGFGGGFGGGDDAGTKKSGSGCFKCGEDGHFSRECPKAGGGGGGGGKGCFKCGEEGHMSRECPKAGEGGDGGGGGGEKKGCFKCKGDHLAADCDQPDKCRKCKGEHMTSECELPDKCYRCGGEGHMSSSCEEPEKCRRCGEEGHLVKECTQPEATRMRENEDGTKTEIYVPTEIADDKLFEQGLNTGINFDSFDDIPVKSSGENVPKPMTAFADASLRQLLVENIAKSGYTKPTPIQKHAIPCVLAKRDLMGCAQTGSGKTAAFLLPILHTLLEEGCSPDAGSCPQKPQAVIVAPTRELAIQIKDESRKFSAGSMLKTVVAYGGTSVGFQLGQLFRGCNVLIATPGRLMDFVEKEKVSFENVKFLVLDEADRMLDMGFNAEIVRITSSAGMPAKGERQTLMFSATFPDAVQQMAMEYLQDYLFLAVGIVGGACKDVKQNFYEVEKFGKRDKLIEIIREGGTDRTLVFVETKRNADFLAAFLSGEGLPTTSIHGDRLQREREEALADFRSGRMSILVATGVASRGLDIKGVAHVVNYDLPKEVDEYVHRIGRTGRLGNLGKASSFFDPGENSDVAPALVRILSDSQQTVPEFLSNCSGGGGGGYNAGAFGGDDVRPGATTGGGGGGGDDEDWG